MRQAIGPGIQFAISDADAIADECHGRRLPGSLAFECLVQAITAARIRRRHIPAVQQLPAFAGGQNIQAVGTALGGLLKCLDQAFQGPLHHCAGACRVKCRANLGTDAEPFAAVVDGQHQRIVGALFAAQYLDAFPGPGGRVTAFSRPLAMPVVEQAGEQRRWRGDGAATLSQGQRGMFVLEQSGQQPMGAADTGRHAFGGQVDTDRQGIDERPEDALGTLAAVQAPEQYGAEHHVVATAGVRHHLPPGDVEQAGRTHAQRLGRLAQTLAEAGVEHQPGLADTAAITLDVEQAERCGRFAHPRQHVAEELFLGRQVAALDPLRDKIAVRQGRQQAGRVAVEQRLDLGIQLLKRGVIVDDVMEQAQAEPAPTGLVPGDHQAHQRCPVQWQPVVSWVEALAQLRGDIAFGRVQVQLFDQAVNLPPDHLHRLIEVVPEH